MDEVAAVVPEDLKLDVVRVFDEFLDVNTGIAEGLFRLGTAGVEAFYHRNVVVGHAHAATAASCDRLDHHRITDLLGDGQGLLFVLNDPLGAGRGGDSGFLGQSAGDLLVLQGIHRPGAWADEADVAALADIREVGVLRKETVAGMNGVHVRNLGSANQPVDAQIALFARAFTNTDGFISHLNMHGVGIRFRINRHGADVQVLAGANDPDGYLAAVGNEDFLKHGVQFSVFSRPVVSESDRERRLGSEYLLFESERADFEKRLAELNGLGILSKHRCDDATSFSFDFVHDLHGLNDANHGVRANFGTHIHVWSGFRGG